MFKISSSWGDDPITDTVDKNTEKVETLTEDSPLQESTEEKQDISTDPKDLTLWQKQKRQLKNKRRCKNKFKKDGDIVAAIKKVAVDSRENLSEIVQPVKVAINVKKEDGTKKVEESGIVAEMAPEKDSLAEKLVNKLLGSRFRYINEQLYSCSSNDAKNLFENDPESFNVYHQGFLSQVKKWPVKPLDEIIQWVKSKPPKLVVADFGCGEAFLAQHVKNKVHSFDLVALNNRVTVCDISHVPLSDESVDVVVFCLSLMGTNCQEFVIEANRVLKEKGILKIAEVASRYKSTKMFVNDMKSLGFSLKKKDLTNTFFYMFEFVKSKALSAKVDKQYKGLQLSACLYKKR